MLYPDQLELFGLRLFVLFLYWFDICPSLYYLYSLLATQLRSQSFTVASFAYRTYAAKTFVLRLSRRSYLIIFISHLSHYRAQYVTLRNHRRIIWWPCIIYSFLIASVYHWKRYSTHVKLIFFAIVPFLSLFSNTLYWIFILLRLFVDLKRFLRCLKSLILLKRIFRRWIYVFVMFETLFCNLSTESQCLLF